MTIRPACPTDTPVLLEMTRGTGVFRDDEIVALKEVLDDYHGMATDEGHRCVVLDDGPRILGMAYYAAAAMTDRTWYLWWIVVAKTEQARGLGTRLLGFAEDAIRASIGRQLLIETSSLPAYEPTRRFYLRHGYEQVAAIPDYYAEGDDMLVFRRRLLGEEGQA